MISFNVFKSGMVSAVFLTIIFSATSRSAASDQIAQDNRTDPFQYDPSKKIVVNEGKTESRDGAVIVDIDYPSYENRHGRIKAYLVKPAGLGSFAGILFFHWLGETRSDRTEFLDEAVKLAGQGTVSLLIDGFFPWKEAPKEGPKDLQQIIDQTIEVRRAVDLLLSQPDVDPKRVAFVGHDYGAMFGAINSGLDHRVKAHVLMAGLGNFSDWSLKYWPITGKQGADTYREKVSRMDPIRYVKDAAPTNFLFQFSNKDKYITRDQADQFFKSASEPKTIKWYDTDHQLGIDAVARDRIAWLTEQLELSPVVASQR